ncbi:DUF1287 domain-containing protein [Verrucomicrobiaceae bacterium N1E253]|uniref:DUF1287 domain-containing protein n=2 Tax=Oceaniferula marina TaxID=2748318 RepID=A0A851GD66_9BACT|nr:DUF1287 domain-containing protein [Oceaniferula marina]
MVLLVIVGVGYVSRPFVGKILAQAQPVTDLKVEKTVAWLDIGDTFGHALAKVALERTHQEVQYDAAYFKIDYPGGDVPGNRGTNTDVIVRSYRALGIDLQQLVHEDMKKNFRIYPQLWGAQKPDTNIDHRRVENLQRFFTRHGSEFEIPVEGVNMHDVAWGDVVVWLLPNGDSHIGIVVPGPEDRRNEMWVVHNNGEGPKWEDVLLEYQVIGHYRYDG